MPSNKPVPRTISDIVNKIGNVSFTSHYQCQFSLPPAGRSFFDARGGVGFLGSAVNINNEEVVRLSCAEASLPGSSLATTEINNDYSGVTERHAYRRLYDSESSFTFYVDNDYRIVDFFENWIAWISGGETDTDAERGRDYNYRFNFPSVYTSDSLYITKFERDYTGRRLSYQFINAFPLSINSMPISYETSQVLKCTVSFAYSRYVIDRSRI